MPGMNKDKPRETDNELIEGLKTGNSGDLKSIYSSCYPVIKSLVLRNNGSEYEAKDVFQDALVLLFEKLQQPGFTLTCSVKTFIYAVSKRLWLKKWNEKKIRVYDTQFEAEPESMDGIFETMIQEESLMARMNKAVEELGEPCATLLKDFYIRDLSMADIAGKMGYTNAENAKNQKYKCLQRLKRLFFMDEIDS